jgi:bifunctional non-homologous end joining protein LigD
VGDKLDAYRHKRDPQRTSEPFGSRRERARSSRFVVQRHSARRLHYDLRLERDGVLLSWAVPKGLPVDPGSRRRAIHTEDHPLEYLDFQGVIPEGQYGAGVMDVYDTGSWELLDESSSGSLTFHLRGERLRGTFTLASARLEGEEQNWLLIRRDGQERLRRDYEPMQPTVRADLPGGEWLYEVAWNGERAVARLHEGDVDASALPEMIAKRLGRGVRVFDCVLDGEVSDVEGEQHYYVYDLLELEGEPLLSRPLAERRALLEPLLDQTERTVRLSETFKDGARLLELARARGLAGVVAKDPASRYVPGARSPDWVAVLPDAKPGLNTRETELRRGKRTVSLTRLDYLWWPDTAVRKGDLIEYYRAVASVLLPHLRRRPFTLKRHLNGPNAPFEWVKDAPPEMPDWIPTCPLPAKSRAGKTVNYPLVDDELALVWMLEYGCIDLHLWYSRCDRPERPDYVLFDLDPAHVPFERVVHVAHLLHELLRAIGLEAFVRTSGGEGLHVQVPVARRYGYAETRQFAELIADALVRARPDLVTTERDLKKRRGVFLDTKMNGQGMTIASLYSVRPLPGPPVATPLEWEELESGLDPAEFTMPHVLDRVAEHGDLHAGLLSTPQRLEPALARVS